MRRTLATLGVVLFMGVLGACESPTGRTPDNVSGDPRPDGSRVQNHIVKFRVTMRPNRQVEIYWTIGTRYDLVSVKSEWTMTTYAAEDVVITLKANDSPLNEKIGALGCWINVDGVDIIADHGGRDKPGCRVEWTIPAE